MKRIFPFQKVLLFYKTSTYQHCISSQKSHQSISISAKHFTRFKQTHERHYKTISKIERILSSYGVSYRKVKRGQKVNFKNYDLIVTVGGDGTVLDAAKSIGKQPIFGINSDPKWSVGKLCFGNSRNLKSTMLKLAQSKFRVQPVARLLFKFKGEAQQRLVLNDILICHKNPATMSRYILSINGLRDEHKSSGLWVSSAAGSTAAIHSAGGRTLALTSKYFQYLPRELYFTQRQQYKLQGGTLAPMAKISIISLMEHGMIYIDGAHVRLPFPLGKQALISQSQQPLRMIQLLS